MLNGDAMLNRKMSRKPGRVELRMQVVCNDDIVPFDVVHRQQIPHGIFESRLGFTLFEISNVLTDDDISVDNQCDRIFKVAS